MRGVWMIAVTKGANTSPCMAFTTTLGQAVHIYNKIWFCVLRQNNLKQCPWKKYFKNFSSSLHISKCGPLTLWQGGHERVQNLGTVSPDVVFVKLVGPYPITLIQSPVE